MTVAVILIRAGALPEQQQTACLDYCHRHRYTARSLAFTSADAAALVDAGAVTVVVTAYADPDDDYPLQRAIRATGGRLEHVRPARGSAKVAMGSIIVGMFERDATVPVIAHLLDETTGEVRRHLRRHGLVPTRTGPGPEGSPPQPAASGR